jgi:PAS domain S-box-containing protein
MILLADLDGNLLEVNKKAQELLGYAKEELTVMHYSMIHPTEELERISDAFAEIILKGRTYFKDGIILKKDGTTIPVDITGSLISYAGKLLVQEIFSDRTERKKAEDELKQNEKELQKRVKELEEFYDMAVGRELRMVALKNEIERLKKDLERKIHQ